MQKKQSVSAPKIGMNRDTHIAQLKQTDYTFAMNANVESEDGNSLNISNEPSNTLSVMFPIGYKVIGFKKDILNEKTYYFLTNPTTKKSSIGYVKDERKEISNDDSYQSCGDCGGFNQITSQEQETADNEYVEIVNDICHSIGEGLNFDLNYPIKFIEIKTEKLSTTLYWNDYNNPPRYIVVSDISYLFIEEVSCGDDIETECIIVDKLLQFPKHTTMVITPEVVQIGGNLKMGVYEFYGCYSDEQGNEITEYCTPTNPISIFDENNNIITQSTSDSFTNYAIKLKVDNLDTRFKYYKVVCVERTNVNDTISAFIAGIYSTTNNNIIYSSSGSVTDDVIAIKNSSVKRRVEPYTLGLERLHIEKAKGDVAINNKKFMFGLKMREELNLQPVVNLFGSLLKWQVSVAKEDLYKSAIATSNYAGYRRDEVYPFGIRFGYKNGGKTAVFPLIGRPANIYDLTSMSNDDPNYKSISENSTSCVTTSRNKKWQFENTATQTDYCSGSTDGTIVAEEVTKTCRINNVYTITEDSLTIEIDDSYTNLEDFINDNYSDIINPSNVELYTTIGQYLVDTYPDDTCNPLFASSCVAPPTLDSESIVISNTENEVTTLVEKNESNYIKSKAPQFCQNYETEADGSKIRDTEFENDYLICESIVYKRTIPDNEECDYAVSVQNNNDPLVASVGYYSNYAGDTLKANLLTAKDASISSVNFDTKLHKNAVWFKINKLNRESIIFEITKNTSCNTDESIVGSVEELRYSFYANCSSTSSIGGGIVNTNNGILTKIDIATFPNTFYVAIDAPIVETYSIAEECGTCETVLLPNYPCTQTPTFIIAPPCGCFSVFTRDLEYTGATVSWDNIVLDKIQTYKSECDFFLPKVDDCDPKPFVSGEFAYWQSIETYPDNEELYNSSTIRINPSDINVLTYADKIRFINYYLENNTVLNGNQLIEGNYYIVKIEGSDDFNNIGGFINENIFLCENTGTPNIWNDSVVTEISVNGSQNLILIEADFRCAPIRHFKMPDNKVTSFISSNSVTPLSDSLIYPLGVSISEESIISMLLVALNNELVTEEQLINIESFEILRGDNTIHKSVIANALAYDIYEYNNGGNTYGYSNYPHNDLGDDLFHFTDGNRNTLIPHPRGGSGNNKFTLISPDLLLTRPNIPSEVTLSGFQLGNSLNMFTDVNKHPMWTILGSDARRTAKDLAVAEYVIEVAIKVLGAQTQSALGNIWFVGGFANGTNAGGAGASVGFIVTYTLLAAAQGFAKLGQYRYQWLKTFRDLGTAYNFAGYGISKGHHNQFLVNTSEEDYIRAITTKKHIKDGRYNIRDSVTNEKLLFNNHLREYSSFISTGNYDFNYISDYINYDNNKLNPNNSSKTVLSNSNCEINQDIQRNIGNPYFTLKNYIPDQFGTIDSINWITTNYSFKIGEVSSCKTIFGGNVFISRFSWLRKIPFFTTNAMGQPDKTAFEYSKYKNIGHPRFFCDYETDTEFNQFLIPFPDIDSNYNFDCERGRRSFYVKPPSKMYLYYYGQTDFLVESEINCNMRYNGKELKDSFYPNYDLIERTQEVNVSIKEPNTFMYNNVYSSQVSFPKHRKLEANYNKEEWYRKSVQDNRVIYSNPDNTEYNLYLDPWLVYKPLNGYEFDTKYGTLQRIQNLHGERVLGLFSNQAVIFNKVDNLAERITPLTSITGDSGIFTSRPAEFSLTDLGFAGTQNSELSNTPYGNFYVDAKRGKVWNIQPSGDGLEPISDSVKGKPSGMKNWFREHLPFKILKQIPQIDTDNKFKGIGFNMWYDARMDRVFFTKKDIVVKKGVNINLFTIDNNKILYDNVEVQPTNTNLFEDVSWTIAFNPMIGWISYYSFNPNFSVAHQDYFSTSKNNGTLWNHYLKNKSFQNFYGVKEPFIIEYPVVNENVNKQLLSLSLNVEAKRWQGDWDFAENKEVGFNRINIYNNTNNSGLLNLVLQKSLSERTKYPKTNTDNTQDILYTSEDGKHNVNYLYNRVKNQNNNIPQWLWDKNMINKSINPLSVSFYGKKTLERLKGETFIIRLINDVNSDYQITFKNSTQIENVYN